MRHIRIMGLCLVAVFAMSAVAAASASAAEPEFLVCKKVAEKTGGFNDSLCTVPSSGGTGEGIYKSEVPPTAVAYTTTSGAAKLETQGAGSVECTSSTSKGKIDAATGSPKSSKTVKLVVVKFKGCKTNIGGTAFTCNTAGQEAGKIVTAKLRGVLGYLEKTPVKVGVARETETIGAYSSEFECAGGGLKVRTHGAVIGVEEGDVNVFSKKYKRTFAQTGGIQEWTKFETPPGPSGTFQLFTEFDETGLGGKGFGENGEPPGGLPSAEEVKSTVKNATAIEIKA
jgi:hypothetical protein